MQLLTVALKFYLITNPKTNLNLPIYICNFAKRLGDNVMTATVIFKKKFEPKRLKSTEIKVLKISPNGTKDGKSVSKLRYQKKTIFNNWRTYEMLVSSGVYSSFRTRYKLTQFAVGRSAVLGTYEGGATDVELVWSKEELAEFNLEGSEEDALQKSIISKNEVKINSEESFKNGWFFDGTYAFKPILTSDSIIMSGVKMYKSATINLFNLKGGTIINEELQVGGRSVLAFEDEDGTALSTTISSSARQKGPGIIWNKIIGNPDYLSKVYLNIDTAVKLYTTLGSLYGHKKAEEVDMFSICLSIKAFPFQLDDASKLLAEWKREDSNGVPIPRVKNIKDILGLIIKLSSQESSVDNLKVLSKQLQHLSTHGISHFDRVSTLFKKGAENKNEFVDIFAPVDKLLSLDELGDLDKEEDADERQDSLIDEEMLISSETNNWNAIEAA